MDNPRVCATASTECNGPIIALGLCRHCYKRQYRESNRDKLSQQERNQYSRNIASRRAAIRKHKYSAKGRYTYMKDDAKKRGLECTLSLGDYSQLISNSCHYCENPLPPSRCTGLDRIDNSKGYISGNVLPCCANCNYLRMHILTVDETKVAATAIKQYRAQRLATV